MTGGAASGACGVVVGVATTLLVMFTLPLGVAFGDTAVLVAWGEAEG
jgi:hypothetical protein